MPSTIISSDERDSQTHVTYETDTPYCTPRFRPYTTVDTPTPYSIPVLRPAASRRTASFGSSTSFSSNSSPRSISFGDRSYGSPLFSPGTPLKSSGIPFSWELIPGIPKNQNTRNKDSSNDGHDLPLPPAGSRSNSFRKASKEDIFTESFRKDPFFAAMVECSKDHEIHHDGIGKMLKMWKMPKILSDQVTIMNMYASCKRACSVSDSLVCLPRSRPRGLVNHRRST